jgi:RNA polymerase sigma-70 factor (ECF subfamily)
VNQLPDDFQLIRSFQRGDEAAFEELVRRYHRQVANLIYLTLGGRSEVEDLTQDAFLRVHRSLPRFKFDASFYSWLYRIVVNLCIDETRRRKVRRVLSLDFLKESGPQEDVTVSTTLDGLDSMMEDEKRERVVDALQRLSAEHRTVLVLREYNDMSYAEIAKVLKITPQAVKSRIFRAREHMRHLLKDYFQERL